MMFYQDLQKGSFYSLRAHGKGGASATILFLSAPPPEKSAGGSQQAGKKGGGWGEGIFGPPSLSDPDFSAAAEFRISLCEMRRRKI